MATSNLQALFANLRPRNQESPSPLQTDPSTPHRSSSRGVPNQTAPASSQTTGPLFSSLPSDLSHDQKGSTNGLGAPTATSQSLLNLLNFGPAPSTSPKPDAVPVESTGSKGPNEGDRKRSIAHETSGQGPARSASDLLATFMTPSPSATRISPDLQPKSEGARGVGEQHVSQESRDPSQDALLKLISKTRPGHKGHSRPSSTDTPGPEGSPDAMPGNPAGGSSSSQLFDSRTPASDLVSNAPAQNRGIFTYTNPFEALNASRSQTPKAGQPEPAIETNTPRPSIEIASEKVERDSPRQLATPEQVAARRILTPRLPSRSKPSAPSREASVPAAEPDMAQDVAPELRHSLTAPDEAQPPAYEEATADANIVLGVQEDRRPEHPADLPTSGGGDEWEDTEESPTKEVAPRLVPVYNFPIKPFVSITLQLASPSDITIREAGVMEISRLKKEFDQFDRSLAAATSKYIAYALIKNGGMRIIRQDDGRDRQVFKNSHDRIFNVSLCTVSSTGAASDDQAVIGTGVSGAVYYATISKDGNDLFEKNEIDSESLIFPAHPPAEDSAAGGVLKTRAKRSSRHPEFLAIGRRNTIHLVWPATALSSRYGITETSRRVDMEKFLQDHTLQISIGKGGKDFTFSEDDSLIVSLDKSGKLRFWDIRKLIDESNATAARVGGTFIDMPLLSLSTALPSEKSWPTSVLFVDKVRPYVKGGPLRYVLVGLRQNHTLQLWDIALRKAVQELNFPHDHDTDGICSVSYHALSGIIVVGHPTRNSFFFIHLSAPRYTLSSSLSQAAYVQRIAAKDPEIPKPESTACMSGVREISFGSRGFLRSVEILPIHRSVEAQRALDISTALFELYVVHSKGVTCLSVNKEDLGWNEDSKVIHPIDATKQGVVSLKELKLGTGSEDNQRGISPVEEAPPPTKPAKKKSNKKAAAAGDAAATESQDPIKLGPVPTSTNGSGAVQDGQNTDNAATKDARKSKKKSAQQAEPSTSEKTIPATEVPASPSPLPANGEPAAEKTALHETTSTEAPPHSFPLEATTKPDAVSVGISGDWLDKELKKVERSVSGEFRKELNVLYQNIQNDRVVQDSSAVARQEALLRLVSTTLTNNVEKALARILAAQLHQSMVPALTGATVQAVSSQVGEAVAKSLHSMVPHELGVQLPVAINSALQNPQMTRTIADLISHKVSKQTESFVADMLQKEILPAFRSMAAATAEKAASQVEIRLQNEITQLRDDRKHDLNRLEKLGQVIEATAETLKQMSDTQVAFQGQILRDRRHFGLLGESQSPTQSRQVSTARLTPSPRPTGRSTHPRSKTSKEMEYDTISQLMNQGRYEEGSIRWLQSSQPVELFDNLFIHFTPEYLATDVSSLIAFSIAVTIGTSLVTNTIQRLEWISAAFQAVDLKDPEITDLAQHAPALLNSLIAKLEGLYMTIAERDPLDPALKIMPLVSRKAKEMRAFLAGI